MKIQPSEEAESEGPAPEAPDPPPLPERRVMGARATALVAHR
jgi:hypothetical protein